MTTKKDSITIQLLSKEVVEQNKVALDIVGFYSKVSDIIERTHVAMGKKKSYKLTNSTTKNQKLHTNAYASTY